MTLVAYEHGRDRFVGLPAQWDLYSVINGISGESVHETKPADEERARWRREGWFVVASVNERVSVEQRAGDFLETCKGALCVHLTENPARIALDRPGNNGRCVSLFLVETAELFALEILRQCKAARAMDAKAAAEGAIDETQWEHP